MINPKKLFQEGLTPDSKFRNLILTKDFQNALSLSMTALALENRSAEEIKGATRFVEIFTSIGEPIQERAPVLPMKRLKSPEEVDASQPAPKPAEPTKK
jgi:hypothetical protein